MSLVGTVFHFTSVKTPAPNHSLCAGRVGEVLCIFRAWHCMEAYNFML